MGHVPPGHGRPPDIPIAPTTRHSPGCGCSRVISSSALSSASANSGAGPDQPTPSQANTQLLGPDCPLLDVINPIHQLRRGGTVSCWHQWWRGQQLRTSTGPIFKFSGWVIDPASPDCSAPPLTTRPSSCFRYSAAPDLRGMWRWCYSFRHLQMGSLKKLTAIFYLHI